MVARKDILTAQQAIREALEQKFPQAYEKVYVFETEWGHLRALIGSDSFKDVSLIERQQIVWDHLRTNVPREQLTRLYGVHPMDIEEYDSRVSE